MSRVSCGVGVVSCEVGVLSCGVGVVSCGVGVLLSIMSILQNTPPNSMSSRESQFVT